MTALIDYGTGTLEIGVQFAIGQQASVWDLSSWNFSEWSSEQVGGWVDVTCDVSELNLTAGASQPDGVVTAINGTTGGVILHGDQYNPWAPPWGDNGSLGPRVPVRLQWRHAYPNLVPKQVASLEDGTTAGWTPEYQVRLANSTAQALDGTHSLAMTATVDGGIFFSTSDRIPVVAGHAYDILVPFRAAGASRSCYLYVRTYDSSGTYLTTLPSFGPVMDNASGWTTLSALGQVMAANVAYLSLHPYIIEAALGEVHYVDAMVVSQTPDALKTFFTGVTDGWPFERSSGTALVPIIDATGGLANLDLAALDSAAAVGQGEALSARMNRILNQAAWPTGLRAIATDARKVISTTFGASPWSLLQTAADTGLGLLWIKRTGEVAYLPVGQAGGWVPHFFGTNLTDTHADATNVCVVDYKNSDPQVMRNAVTISRAADSLVNADAPVEATLVDQQSVNQYGPATYSKTDLIQQDDAWSATVAGAVLLDGAWPAMHPQIADLDIRFDTRVADLLLATEIGDVVVVHDSGQLFQCAVVGWTVDITHKGLSGSLVLSDISQWTGGLWGTDVWDRGSWSI